MAKKTDKDIRSQLNEYFKKNSGIEMASDIASIPRIKTGSIGLDFILDGGLPEGKIMEFYGPSGGGKSSLALQIIAAMQKAWEKAGLEYLAAYVDMERSANIDYFKSMGVDTERLIVLTPNSAEEAIDRIKEIITLFPIKIVVLDSLAAMTTAREMDADAGDSLVAETAKANTRFLRTMTTILDEHKCSLIVINQLRDNFNAMAFGKKTKTFGGHATEYFSSIRIDIKRIGSLKEGQEVIGNKVKAEVVKSRFSPPHRSVELEIIFGEGFSRSSEIFDRGKEFKVIKFNGSHASYGDIKLGNGKAAVRKFLEENPEIAEEIEDAILKAMVESRRSNSKTSESEVEIEEENEETPDFVK